MNASAWGSGTRPVEFAASTNTRFCCTVRRRADSPREDPRGQPLRRLLDRGRGYLESLEAIFDVDLRQGFPDVAEIARFTATAQFSLDRASREAQLGALCRQALGDGGLLAIRPRTGLWQPPPVPPPPGAGLDPWNGFPEALRLCQLFGSCAFAQICDPAMTTPIPLFVRPWCPRRGLLLPRRWPTESFSESLCVHRLPNDGMVLLEKPRPGGA